MIGGGLGQESLCIWMSMWHMKMEGAERLPGLDTHGLRKRASAKRRKRHRHLLLTQHLPNFGTESEIGVETMCGERSSGGQLLLSTNSGVVPDVNLPGLRRPTPDSLNDVLRKTKAGIKCSATCMGRVPTKFMAEHCKKSSIKP